MKINKIVEWLVVNWSLIVAFIAVAFAIYIAVDKFLKLPNKEQVERIKRCLLSWVIEAEKDLGGGTGKIKLSMVYSTFVSTFPVLKNFVPFEVFSKWVDEALETMRTMLKDNTNLMEVVEGKASTKNPEENSGNV